MNADRMPANGFAYCGMLLPKTAAVDLGDAPRPIRLIELQDRRIAAMVTGPAAAGPVARRS